MKKRIAAMLFVIITGVVLLAGCTEQDNTLEAKTTSTVTHAISQKERAWFVANYLYSKENQSLRVDKKNGQPIKGFVFEMDQLIESLNKARNGKLLIELGADPNGELNVVVTPYLENGKVVRSYQMVILCPPDCP